MLWRWLARNAGKEVAFWVAEIISTILEHYPWPWPWCCGGGLIIRLMIRTSVALCFNVCFGSFFICELLYILYIVVDNQGEFYVAAGGSSWDRIHFCSWMQQKCPRLACVRFGFVWVFRWVKSCKCVAFVTWYLHLYGKRIRVALLLFRAVETVNGDTAVSMEVWSVFAWSLR